MHAPHRAVCVMLCVKHMATCAAASHISASSVEDLMPHGLSHCYLKMLSDHIVLHLLQAAGPPNGFATRNDTRELAKLGMTSRHVQQQVDISLCHSLQLFARLPAAAYVMASQLASAVTDRSQVCLLNSCMQLLLDATVCHVTATCLKHVLRVAMITTSEIDIDQYEVPYMCLLRL